MSANPIIQVNSTSETNVASDAANGQQLAQEFAQLKRRFDEQARKLSTAELGKRAAEDEARRAKEELEARRHVNDNVLEKRVEEAVLKAQASEVAKRRKAEQELDRLKAELNNAVAKNATLKSKLESAVEQLTKQEDRYKEWAKQEIQKYKKAAKAAWRGAEDEVANLENEIVHLRDENEKLLNRIAGAAAADAPAVEIPTTQADLAKSVASAESSTILEKVGSAKSSKERLRDAYGDFLGQASVGSMDVPTLDDAPVKTGLGSARADKKPEAPRAQQGSAADLFDHLEHLEKVEGSKTALNAYLNPSKALDLGDSVIQEEEEVSVDGIEDDFTVELPGKPGSAATPSRATQSQPRPEPAQKAVEQPQAATQSRPATKGVLDVNHFNLDEKPNAAKLNISDEDVRAPTKVAKKGGGIFKWFAMLIVLMAASGGGAYYYLTSL